ncbi:MAG: histidine kinase [Bacteroidetes bacterium]|nr:histidine kinase [Bacteroidota bacterium]
MKFTSQLVLYLLILFYSAFSQEYSYTHYDISEGLAGSTVYCITQDKDGFIWTGTETGVSRFDGTHFRNFTARDGLSDVEILEMFGDSYGRVWMAPFRKSICYYYKGVIHNQENDSLLRTMQFHGNVEHFAEDASGNILIQEARGLYMVARGGRVQRIDSINHVPIANCHSISRSAGGYFLVHEQDSVFELKDGAFKGLFRIMVGHGILLPSFLTLSPEISVWRKEMGESRIRSLSTGKERAFPFAYPQMRQVCYSIVDDTIVYSNEVSGSTEYRLHSGTTRNFLPGIEVSRTFRDDEGDLWFTTIGHGLYRLNSTEIRTISLKQPPFGDCAVHSIVRAGGELLVGSNHNSIFRFSLPSMESLGLERFSNEERKRVLFIDTLDKGRMIYGCDYTLLLHGPSVHTHFHINVKSGHMVTKNDLLFSSSFGAFRMKIDKFGKFDTLWNERTTTLFYKDDTIYIGTLNGLYRLTGNREKGYRTYFMGTDIPFLRKRIASIVESSNGVLWIAPYDDAGLIGVKDGKGVGHIGEDEGLTSDICKTLVLQNDYLWIGTDKGLNRVNLRSRNEPVLQLKASDGLGSNLINTIYVDSPMVYVGTPAGLSLFDQNRVGSSSRCRITWLDISSAGHSLMGEDMGRLLLPYQRNNIHFEFVGLSYKSAGSILYKYRLLGLDTSWKTTRQTFLDYPTLPSGDYELQVMAINKFGTPSILLSQPFEVMTPFWRRAWFDVIAVVGFLSVVWLIVSFRISHIRKRQQEEKELHRRMAEMEHTALQAQMNPHFIFNCLNSIQQYIFDQDIFAANKYITGFSRLIRQTLQNSNQSLIPIADEVSYLSSYLSLEKLRFKDKMDYVIEVASDIDQQTVVIPPMLIQPYVENSMRHGLRHKTSGKGMIRIRMEASVNNLTITVEDNGIGRHKAAGYKTGEHIEYQSRGMSLTAERISIMNSLQAEDIGVQVIDLMDEEGQAAGTRVIVKFPLVVQNDSI